MGILLAANKFYKIAIDIPENLKWIPESYQEHLKKVDIEKHPLLKGFREKLTFNENNILMNKSNIKDYEYTFKTSLMNTFRSVNEALFKTDNYAFNEKNKTQYKNEAKIIYEFLQKLVHGGDEDWINDIRDGKIRYGNQEVKLVKFYNHLVDICKKEIGPAESVDIIVPIYGLEGFDDWEKRITKDYEFEVVFSSDVSDILGMSSRSQWTSCQNIRPGSKHIGGLAKGVLGSCESKYIGIIYITDGSDFEGRGEKMFYRAIVYLLRHKENENEYMFVISKIYPEEDPNDSREYAETIFSRYLNKYLPTMSQNDLSKLYSSDELMFGFIEQHHKHDPYIDVDLPTIATPEYIEKQINAGDWGAIENANPKWDNYIDLAKKAIYKNVKAINRISANDEKLFNLLKYLIQKYPEYIGTINSKYNRHDLSQEQIYELQTIAAIYDPFYFKEVSTDNPKYDEIIETLLAGPDSNIASLLCSLPFNHPRYKEVVFKIIDKAPFHAASYLNTNSPDINELIEYMVKKYGMDYNKWFSLMQILMITIKNMPESLYWLKRLIDIDNRYIELIPLIQKQFRSYDAFKEIVTNAIKHDPDRFIMIAKYDWENYWELSEIALKSNKQNLVYIDDYWKLYGKFIEEMKKKGIL